MGRTKKSKRKGKFIVIEGLDGSGSTTQVQLVSGFLNLNGLKTYATKEPTNNVIGGLIRGALTGVYSLPMESLQFLFSADRSHHLHRVIEPQITNGINVICDRYMWSTVAFGSTDIDRNWLLEMQNFFVRSDLTIFLKVDPKECVRRIKKDRYDIELFEEEVKLKKVWRTYGWLAKKFPKEIKIVDGEGTKKEVLERIVSHVKKMFVSELS